MPKELFVIKVFEEERLCAFQSTVKGTLAMDEVFVNPNVAIARAGELAKQLIVEWQEEDEAGRFTIVELARSYDVSARDKVGFLILDYGVPSERWVLVPISLNKE